MIGSKFSIRKVLLGSIEDPKAILLLGWYGVNTYNTKHSQATLGLRICRLWEALFQIHKRNQYTTCGTGERDCASPGNTLLKRPWFSFEPSENFRKFPTGDAWASPCTKPSIKFEFAVVAPHKSISQDTLQLSGCRELWQ